MAHAGPSHGSRHLNRHLQITSTVTAAEAYRNDADESVMDQLFAIPLTDSICYMINATIARMREDAQMADDLHERSRKLLVDSVRAGVAAGLSQRQISEAIGRSQPEVSRLLRFHGHTPLGKQLERRRAPLLKMLTAAGARNVRVFGSVARGEDGPESDIDLLVDFTEPLSLFALSRLEAAASAIAGAKVDVVPSANVRANMADSVRAESVRL